MKKKIKTRVDREIEADLISIDPHSLDAEWIEQPRLAHRFAALSAEASKRVEEAKANLELVRADLAQQFRATEGKKTEASISEQICLAEEYQQAMSEVVEARYRKDLLQGVCNAIEHRKRALENLVSLFLADYFSTPRNREKGEEGRERVDSFEKKAVRERVKEALAKRRRQEEE